MAKSDTWKALLEQHDELVKTSNGTLYDRVTILKQVVENEDYLKQMRARKKNAFALLDEKVSDTCANFTELLQILLHFPERDAWHTGNLQAMREEAIAALRASQKESAKGTRPRAQARNGRKYRSTATLAQVRKLEEDKKDLATQKSTVEREVEHLREQLHQANQIIKSLEAQLESARETIGNLNETIALLKIDRKESPKRASRRRATVPK